MRFSQFANMLFEAVSLRLCLVNRSTRESRLCVFSFHKKTVLTDRHSDKGCLPQHTSQQVMIFKCYLKGRGGAFSSEIITGNFPCALLFPLETIELSSYKSSLRKQKDIVRRFMLLQRQIFYLFPQTNIASHFSRENNNKCPYFLKS